MKELLRNIEGYAEFKRECRFFNCEEQYPGWVGTEKYCVISALSRDDFERKYPAIAKYISPYILMDAAAYPIFAEYKRNEDKFHYRSVMLESQFGIDSSLEIHHPELIDEDIEEKWILQDSIREALDSLTETEKRRVIMCYFNGLTHQEIADYEGSRRQAITKSILSALEKLKKFIG